MSRSFQWRRCKYCIHFIKFINSYSHYKCNKHGHHVSTHSRACVSFEKKKKTEERNAERESINKSKN